MSLSLKNILKGLLPHAAVEYSVRRHDYLRLGVPASRATSLAFSASRYRALCDARLNLLPPSILSALRTCVDAGAHAGAWTLALLDVFQPERILALECDPRLVGHLTQTMASLPQVQVIDAALASNDDEAAFHQLRHPAGSSLLKPLDGIAREFEAHSWDVIGEVTVKTVRYDSLVEPESEVSILKLDIQGAEKNVLSASTQGLRRTKSVILEVNFTPHYESDAVFAELHDLMRFKGFGLYRLSPAYHRGGRALFCDAVYLQEQILAEIAPNQT